MRRGRRLPAGVDEAVLLNERGEVCDGTITSVFVDRGGGLVTPPLGCGLLPGVLRGEMLARGACREAVLRRGGSAARAALRRQLAAGADPGAAGRGRRGLTAAGRRGVSRGTRSPRGAARCTPIAATPAPSSTLGNVGETVRLSGWVHRVRDHGGVLFIDLRDHYGITQVVADSDSPAFAALEKVRAEWVIRVDGMVKAREAGLVNPKLPTGEIEVYVREVEVLGAAEELPLQVFGEAEYPEETRLKYRFLDLRREGLHANIMLRAKVIASLRKRMEAGGFTEFQTPILTASSPEGARDFLVPSRLHPGKFYALPQAPQQFKQLIMVAGFDRYFQIAPCFRDEDPRADR